MPNEIMSYWGGLVWSSGDAVFGCDVSDNVLDGISSVEIKSHHGILVKI